MQAELQELQKDGTKHAEELIKQRENELSELLSKRNESSYNSVLYSNSNQDDAVRVDKGHNSSVLDFNSNQDDAVRVDKGPISFSDGSRHSGLFDHHIAKFDAESGEHAVTSEMKDYNARLVIEDDVAKMCPSRITAFLCTRTETNWLS